MLVQANTISRIQLGHLVKATCSVVVFQGSRAWNSRVFIFIQQFAQCLGYSHLPMFFNYKDCQTESTKESNQDLKQLLIKSRPRRRQMMFRTVHFSTVHIYCFYLLFTFSIFFINILKTLLILLLLFTSISSASKTRPLFIQACYKQYYITLFSSAISGQPILKFQVNQF